MVTEVVLWARQEAAIPFLAGFHRVSSLTFPQPQGVRGGVGWGGGPPGLLEAIWPRVWQPPQLLASAGCSDPAGPVAVRLGPLLAWGISGTGSLVGCHLWGRTESYTTEAT